VIVDSETGFGNGKMIPAGPLREPVGSGLARAGAIILMGNGTPPLPPFHGPILRASLSPERSEHFRGCKVMAFAGIGRPQKFFHMLASYGAKLTDTKAFPDHHLFTPSEIARLKQGASGAGALLLTTAKDYARLDPAARSGIDPVPVNAAFEDPFALDALLGKFAHSEVLGNGR
jgi:tetraacyldisaccharide 4'-kinase